MKLKKGTLLFLLLICLAYTTLAQEVGYELESTDVTIDDDGMITGCTCTFESKSIIIPKQIGGEIITGIGGKGNGAFQEKGLVAVAFAADSEVTTIGASAFQNNQIATLTLPTTLMTIGNHAFESNSITELSLPENLTTIGSSAFNDNQIETLSLPPTLTTIGANAFSGNTGLTITLPKHAGGTGVTYKDSNDQVYQPGATFTHFDRSLVMLYTLQKGDVTVDDGIIIECLRCEEFVSKRIIIPVTIGETTIKGIVGIFPGVFEDKNLVSVKFADDSEVETIGFKAFQKNQLTTLSLPEGLTTIGDQAFYNNNIKTLDLPTTLVSIEDRAFQKNQLTTLSLPTRLKTIEKFAFANNPITTLSLPPSLETIGESAFDGNNITKLTFPVDSQLKRIGVSAFRGNEDDGGNKLTTLSLPPSLETIGQNAFQYNSLTTLIIPNDSQLKTIGEGAFRGNETVVGGNKLTTLSLPPSLETIGQNAFQYNSLTTVTFNDDSNKSRIQSIGINAFSGNTDELNKGISLPEHAGGTGVTYEDSNDQGYQPGATFTDFDRSLVMSYTLQEGDVTAVGGIITECLRCEEFVSKRIIIPVTIGETTIAGIANQNPGIFEDQNLVSVKFADGSEVTTIGNAAFQNNRITTLTLPASLDTIGERAFAYNAIGTLILPASLKTIGVSAFQNNKITELTLPASLRKIEYEAFYYNDITELTIPNNAQLETIGSYAFQNNHIATLIIPNDSQLKTIGEGAFRGKESVVWGNKLTTLSLPPSLETIGQNAFQYNSLTTVTFNDDSNKSRIQSIGINAFSGNTDELNKGISLPEHAGGTGVTYEDSNDQGYQPGATFTDFDRSLVTLYTLQEGDVTVVGGIITECLRCEEFVSKRIIIPVQIGETTIAGIANQNAGIFARQNLVSVKFADGSEVTTIGNAAFQNNKITTLSLPPSLTVIGDSAFYYNDITELTIPENSQLTTIGDNAFRGHDGEDDEGNKITTLSLPPSLTVIGNWAFYYNKITELTFPDDSQLTSIGERAFSINRITELTLPTALTTIGREAFLLNQITELTFPEDSQLTSIGESAFIYNVSLPSFTLPMATKEGFRTYWQDSNSVDLGTNLTIPQADFGKSFELVSIEQVTLTVEVNDKEGGSIEPSDDHFAIDKADAPSTQKLTAKPNTGWRFDKWVIGGEDENGNPITETVDVDVVEVTVDADKTATAHFVKQVTLTLTIKETEALGKVNGLNAGKNKIDKGADFELKATPASGQRFVSWTIDGKTITNEEYTLPATDTEADIGITVTFEAIPQQVTLTLDIEGEGSINPLVKPNSVDPDNEMKGMYDINTEIELTATPNAGWKFDKWVISDEENKTDKTTTITLDKNKSVTAHFVEGEEAITSILTEVVSATPYPNPVTSQITLKAKDGDLIQLFSPKGKQQYSTQHTGNEIHIIDVSTLSVGVYLVRITDAEGNTTTKRILKK